LDSPVYEPDEEHATAQVLKAKERMDPASRMQIVHVVVADSARHQRREKGNGDMRKIAKKRSEVLTLSARLGRRDKRGSPVEPQAIDMAWVLACRSVGARAAPCVFNNAIKSIFGTVGAFARLETRL
jgi:hypothetical protein